MPAYDFSHLLRNGRSCVGDSRLLFVRACAPGVSYLSSSSRARVLYRGVTGDLRRRVWEHRSRRGDGFAARYGCDRLVWFEAHADAARAIAREKEIKGSRRIVTSREVGWFASHVADVELTAEMSDCPAEVMNCTCGAGFSLLGNAGIPFG